MGAGLVHVWAAPGDGTAGYPPLQALHFQATSAPSQPFTVSLSALSDLGPLTREGPRREQPASAALTGGPGTNVAGLIRSSCDLLALQFC